MFNGGKKAKASKHNNKNNNSVMCVIAEKELFYRCFDYMPLLLLLLLLLLLCINRRFCLLRNVSTCLAVNPTAMLAERNWTRVNNQEKKRKHKKTMSAVIFYNQVTSTLVSHAKWTGKWGSLCELCLKIKLVNPIAISTYVNRVVLSSVCLCKVVAQADNLCANRCHHISHPQTYFLILNIYT